MNPAYRVIGQIDYQSLSIPYDIVVDGLAFPEGPVAMSDGSIWVVEIAGRKLTRVASDGSVTRIAQLEGGPNGAALGPDGWMYICNSGGWLYTTEYTDYGQPFQRPVGQSARSGWIERVRCSDGRVERVYADCEGISLQSPNDLVFDSTGGFYFTDLGKRTATTLGLGTVYYGHHDGRPLLKVADQLLTPNGIGLSPDGKVLYVAETTTRRLIAFELKAPGHVSKAPWPGPGGGSLVVALPGFNGLDSMAVGADGSVYVASLINGGFWQVAPGGSSRHFSIDDPFTTNVCFGGKDMRSIYITLSATGRLARMHWDVPGLPLNY